MATHVQSELGPIFEALESDDYLTIAEGENSYSVAAEFDRLAAEAGVVIHADEACAICRAEDAMFRLELRDGKPWVNDDRNDARPVYRLIHEDLIHDWPEALSTYGPLSREVEVPATECPLCAVTSTEQRESSKP